VNIRAAVTESKGAPFELQWYPVPLPAVLGHEGAGFPMDRIMTYDFDEIDRAARDAEEGLVVKPVLRMV
jgi:Zn-dependent alcohol dehydrogenase